MTIAVTPANLCMWFNPALIPQVPEVIREQIYQRKTKNRFEPGAGSGLLDHAANQFPGRH